MFRVTMPLSHKSKQEAVQRMTGEDNQFGLQLAGTVVAVAHQVEKMLAESLADAGLSASQWLVLQRLSFSGEATMGDLAGATGLPSPSLTRHVDGLVDRALVFRRLDDVDRRRVVIHLSTRGQGFVAERAGQLEELVAPLLLESGLTAPVPLGSV